MHGVQKQTRSPQLSFLTLDPKRIVNSSPRPHPTNIFFSELESQINPNMSKNMIRVGVHVKPECIHSTDTNY